MIIVSFLIHQMLLIVQGTRAVQVLFGLLILGCLFWVSIYYKLYVVNWILSKFFDYFFIVLLILFQDQIRAALTNISFGRKLWKKFYLEQLREDLDEVVEACIVLSKEKVGALIVLERSNGLLNYMQKGSRIDSSLSPDLIYALFQSRSPLHDGAIIISKGKVGAAGCFLPLAENVDIDKHFGTRHRAALGISEATDAIAIAVSEETGLIRVFVHGNFSPFTNDQEKELLAYLNGIISRSSRKEFYSDSGVEVGGSK